MFKGCASKQLNVSSRPRKSQRDQKNGRRRSSRQLQDSVTDALVRPLLVQGEAASGVKEYVESRGLAQISDPAVIGKMLDRILEGHPEQLDQFRSGKTKIQGFFSG